MHHFTPMTHDEKALWTSMHTTFAQAVLPAAASASEKAEKSEDKSTAAVTKNAPQFILNATDLICIPDRWMHSSKKHQYEAGFAAVVALVSKQKEKAPTSADPDVAISTAVDFLPKLLAQAAQKNPQVHTLAQSLFAGMVSKAYHRGDPTDATAQTPLASYRHDNGSTYKDLLGKLLDLPRREKPVLLLALYVLYALSDPDEVYSTLVRVGEHMTVCQPGQQQGADYLLSVAGRKLDGKVFPANVTAPPPPSGSAATAGGGHVTVVGEKDGEEADEEEILEIGFYEYCHQQLVGRPAEGVIPTQVTLDIVTLEDQEQDLRRQFESYFQGYLDDHKERAFLTAVMEPAKFVLEQSGLGIQHMEINGRSFYLAAMMETLVANWDEEPGGGGDSEVVVGAGQVRFPIPINEDDPNQIGVIHPYGNLTIRAIRLFKDPLNFGRMWTGVKELKQEHEANKGKRRDQSAHQYYKAKNRVTHSNGIQATGRVGRPSNVRDSFKGERAKYLKAVKAAEKLGEAADAAASSSSAGSVSADVQQWALMAEHLAFFFSRNFVTKCFETLNGETRPEFVGFRKCVVELFQFFKDARVRGEEMRGIVEMSAVQAVVAAAGDGDGEPTDDEQDEEGEFYAFCYKDDYYTELNVEHVTQFFAWLGVVKPAGTYTADVKGQRPVDDVLLELDEERSEVMDAEAELQRAEWEALLRLAAEEQKPIFEAYKKKQNQEFTQFTQKRAAARKVYRAAQVAAIAASPAAPTTTALVGADIAVLGGEEEAAALVQLFATPADFTSAAEVTANDSTAPQTRAPLTAGGDFLTPNTKNGAPETAVSSPCVLAEWDEKQRTSSFEG